ncbi:MAG: hypothetical protein Q8N29_05295 [Methylobacter sp.]|nr:hypothetical protein [Methylobacter sp.]MDP3054044.1 hypothetical protein [Methylobacter sp.]
MPKQTFQVLRLPWMAEVLEPPGAAPVRLPWMAEVLELPGAAPVKTSKVYPALS